jgi:hypothetical protein
VPAGISRPIVTFSFSPQVIDLAGDRRLGEDARRYLHPNAHSPRVGGPGYKLAAEMNESSRVTPW